MFKNFDHSNPRRGKGHRTCCEICSGLERNLTLLSGGLGVLWGHFEGLSTVWRWLSLWLVLGVEIDILQTTLERRSRISLWEIFSALARKLRPLVVNSLQLPGRTLYENRTANFLLISNLQNFAMASKKKNLKLKSLSHGRPPTAKPFRTPTISSKATRNLIRSHHTLEKQRAKALLDGDAGKAESLAKQIESQGGIEGYQKASLLGQANDRGGDSSKILMEWLEPVVSELKEQGVNGGLFRLLEVGALSLTNACSRSNVFEVERIDLNSQAEGILQQDFMERPFPSNNKERFDIISLSLVLNYVPDPSGRGEMLLRTLQFLRTKDHHEKLAEFLPSLFLVLPASCVTNSRYMDEPKLEAIMKSLGYSMINKKISNKLVYYLWRVTSQVSKPKVIFKKEEVRSGKTRNNFAVVLK